MKRNIRILMISAISMIAVLQTKAQEVAVKTNLVADALANVNVGAEVGVAPKWTVELTGELNAWKFSHGRTWKHWLVMPEARYWLCDRFSGHFFGAEAHAGQYNIGGFNGHWNFLGTDARKLKDSRFQGWFAGAGVTYGYAWILDRHWNIEGEIGLGYSYTRYDRYPCATCGTKTESGKSHNYVGVTKAAINLVYLF